MFAANVTDQEFSVLMSVYQKERPEYLEEALRSIWKDQTAQPSQIVLVKDGPLTDKLEDVIERWRVVLGGLLDIVVLEENSGLGRALNDGLRRCISDLVVRMDADDVAQPERFERLIEFFLEHPDVAVVGSHAIDIDENGAELGVRTVPVSHEEIYNTLWTCPLIHPSVAFRKSVVLAAGSYSVTLKRRQDYELWFRVAASGGRFHNIPESLIKYRITDDTYKRNDFSVALKQALIGFRGCAMLGLGLKARVGVFYPIFASSMPLFLRRNLEKLVAHFDPRKSG